MNFSKLSIHGSLIAAAVFFYTLNICAQTPPSEIKLSIVESVGDGCHTVSDKVNGLVCFDVMLELDVSGWELLSYNIWMDYGVDSTVLTYASDASCHHQDGGDIYQLNHLGKYRFLAANNPLALVKNTPVNIHNFCLNIEDASRLHETFVTPGGNHFNLVSSMNLVSPTTAMAINPLIGSGDSVIVEVVNAIADIEQVQLQMAPNPFSNDIVLSSSDIIQSIEIVDLKGQSQMVLSNINTGSINLQLADLESGLYFAHVRTANGMRVERIMKL